MAKVDSGSSGGSSSLEVQAMQACASMVGKGRNMFFGLGYKCVDGLYGPWFLWL